MFFRKKFERSPSECRVLCLVVRCAPVLFVLACSEMLPDAQETTISPWKGFEDAKAAYEKIEPRKTTISDMKDLGFDPYTTPNVKILSYLEVIERFLPIDSIKVDDLDPGVRECIADREACSGYELNPRDIYSERVGDVVTDMFNFKRTTHRSGWSFRALIIFNRDTVVYKIWRGTPVIEEHARERNPLGPLQDSGDLLRSQIPQ